MEQSFNISVEMLSATGITELMVLPKERLFEVYHHNLLFCTLRKIKGDLWYQVDGDLKHEITEVIGEAIDACLQYA